MSELSETKKMALFTTSLSGIMVLATCGANAVPWTLGIIKVALYIVGGIFAIGFLMCSLITFFCCYAQVTGREPREMMNNIKDVIISI